MKNHSSILRLIISALCLALAYTLPFLTGQIPEIGSMLLPMHVPVLLCGFLCGWKWGLSVGFISPILRSLILGRPILFPMAVCMAIELGAYGLVCGIAYRIFPKKKKYIYLSLIIAMIVGRVLWGIAMAVCMGIKGGAFTFSAFLSGAFIEAIPGIIIQIVLIPILVMVLDNKKVLNLND